MDEVVKLRQLVAAQENIISGLRQALNTQKILAGIEAQEIRRLRRQVESLQAPAQYRRSSDKVS